MFAARNMMFAKATAAGAFDPLSLFPTLWLDASDANTLYDATTGGSLVAADGSIARWEDKSGDDNHATQATGAIQPTRKTSILNSLDIARFNGSVSGMRMVTAYTMPTTGVSVFFVATRGTQQNDTSSILRPVVEAANASTNSGLRSYGTQRGTLQNLEGATEGTRIATVTGNWTTGASIVATFVYSGNILTGYKNGVTYGNVTQAGSASHAVHIGGSPRTGSGGSARRFAGDIAEILIYPTALSDTDRQAVESYLAAKWGVFDADADDYFARIVTAGSTISEANKTAVNAFIVGCKADGIWTAIKASCILAGADTLAGALVPLVGTAPTNNGPFVEGDYSRTTGLVGNGSSKYLNTNFSMTSLTSNSFFVAVGVTTPHTTPSVAGSHFGGGIRGSETCLALARSTGNTDDFFIRCQSTTGDTVTGRGQHTGLVIMTRENSSEWKIRSNGTESTITRASTGLVNKNLFVFAHNDGTLSHSVGRYHFYGFGDFLNRALLDARLATLMGALT